ncbi:berberine bridge enzyme-like 17 [Vigna umbellata]|uniref:berberine bridge enzyme-like 17 n=1 Tax=Vigna umbellata TaxID=87088 RepID=UPI001F5ED6BE|nr:berberine bridge enzyme-like 17 [Vigna umbellata]
MKTMGLLCFFVASLTIMLPVSLGNSQNQSPDIKQFLSCLSAHSSKTIPEAVYTPQNASYTSILNLHVQSKRYKTKNTPKPLAIVTAKSENHVQATVTCAKSSRIQIRIRSGGHDYEAASYVSDVPFVILDMFPLQSVDVDVKSATAWVQAGATIGQVYYEIAKKSNVLAFPAGVCPTLGAGGHISGGGYGNLMRKYGLSVDNIIDARLVDANGVIRDRKSMGEDLFWAIRGGGGASFAAILSWRIKLVPVPPQVTVFNVKRSIKEDGTDVAYKWQLVAPKLDRDLFIRVEPNVVNGTVLISFIGMFLGPIEKLVPMVSKSFPELGLKKSDCIAMPWVNSTLFWDDSPIGTPIQALLPTSQEPSTMYFKSRSDYVKTPIPKTALKGVWDLMIKCNNVWMQWNPYGGVMDEISASATPFPHRKGNLFLIQYFVFWNEDSAAAYDRNMKFSKLIYEFMTSFVSRYPREAFLNYRDNDIGEKHPSSSTSLKDAQVYGTKFFKENFDRLVSVKTTVDPSNFFTYEQSIPPKSAHL